MDPNLLANVMAAVQRAVAAPDPQTIVKDALAPLLARAEAEGITLTRQELAAAITQGTREARRRAGSTNTDDYVRDEDLDPPDKLRGERR